MNVTIDSNKDVFALNQKLLAGDLSAKDASFAKSLIDQFVRRGLSEKQIFWVRKLAQPKPGLREVKLQSFQPIADLFAVAKQHLKYPKVVFGLPCGTELRLSLAGPRASVPGSITVSSGKYGDPDGAWYGRILQDGTFTAGRNSTPEIEEALQAFSADPAGYAAKYGHLTGNCCFCTRRLEDDRSTSVGYGPVCAKNYGLPWGAKPAKATEAFVPVDQWGNPLPSNEELAAEEQRLCKLATDLRDDVPPYC